MAGEVRQAGAPYKMSTLMLCSCQHIVVRRSNQLAGKRLCGQLQSDTSTVTVRHALGIRWLSHFGYIGTSEITERPKETNLKDQDKVARLGSACMLSPTCLSSSIDQSMYVVNLYETCCKLSNDQYRAIDPGDGDLHVATCLQAQAQAQRAPHFQVYLPDNRSHLT